MLIQNKTIAIVGGGPGGLTLARLLQLKGANVKVYERDIDRNVRVQGTTLDLHHESGLKALGEAGLMNAFKENYRPGADKICIVDENAKIYYNENREVKNDDFESEYFRPEIDRGPLRNILLDSLQPNTVVWDSQFVSMVQINNIWKLEFKNGTTAMADIVIGADGANSKIRPFVTPIKSFYAGVTGLEGSVSNAETTVPNVHQLLKGGKIFAFGGSKNLIVASKGDGGLAFYTSCKVNEDWVQSSGINFADKMQVLTWFKKEFAEWDSLWYELFLNTSAPFIPRVIKSMPIDQTWDAQANITLLGDAAHLMTPNAGEGVNMAMLDALELSECLTNSNFNDIQSAISSYEKHMRTRASVAAQESLKNTGWMHADGALAKMLDMFNRFSN